MIPIPQKAGNNMVTLAPIASHIAINLAKDAFVPLSEIELQQCTQFDTDIQLCPLLRPIYHLKSDENLCLKDEGLHGCKTDSVPCRNTWTQLTKVNTYLFFCCEPCPIKIICGHLVTTDRLSKVGIASLGEDCLIKGDDVTVVSHKRQSMGINVQADIINFEIPPINHIINLSIPISKINSVTSSQEQQDIKDLGKQIRQMKTEAVIADQISAHDIHHYVVTYVMMCIVGAGAVGYAVRRLRKRRSARLRQADAGASATPPTHSSAAGVAYRVSDQCVTVKAEQNSDQSVNQYARVKKIPSARVNRSISPIFNRVNHFGTER